MKMMTDASRKNQLNLSLSWVYVDKRCKKKNRTLKLNHENKKQFFLKTRFIKTVEWIQFIFWWTLMYVKNLWARSNISPFASKGISNEAYNTLKTKTYHSNKDKTMAGCSSAKIYPRQKFFCRYLLIVLTSFSLCHKKMK